MFYIGQKVVCIGDDWIPICAGLPDLVNAPRKNGIYTIRGFVQWEHGLGLLLAGIINPVNESGFEPSFDHESFRPLLERKTDISVFQALLNTKELVE
jgi:hypothetical protein